MNGVSGLFRFELSAEGQPARRYHFKSSSYETAADSIRTIYNLVHGTDL